MVGKLFWIVVVVTLAVAAPAPARADDTAFAMENYDLGDYAGAVAQLESALAKAPDAKAKARVHMLLGGVYAAGLRDEGKAREQFTAALRLDPKAELDARFAGDERATALLADVRAVVAPAPEPVNCATLIGIAHDPVERGEAGVAIAVAAHVGGGLKDYPVTLFYRAGDGAFAEAAMARGADCTVAGEIPADAVTGGELAYYIAARNADGKVVATKGTAAAPYFVRVARTDVPESTVVTGEGGEAVEEEVPEELAGPRAPAAPRNGGCAGCRASTGGGAPAAAATVLLAVLAISRRRRSPSPRRGEGPSGHARRGGGR